MSQDAGRDKAPPKPSLVERLNSVYRTQGVRGIILAIVRRIRAPRAKAMSVIQPLVRGATGLEIGGPSRFFTTRGPLPIYGEAARVDNCNFAARTIWEGDASEGEFHFSPNRGPGRQFVAEATNLAGVPAGSYDFVLSSHVLEHSANPLQALAEWCRVLRVGGVLVLVVPHKDGTFDHRRPVTSLAHLMEDFRARRGEDDLTHLEEVLTLHDVARDPGVHAVTLAERMSRNHEFRSMHHHVFDTQLAVDAVEASGFTTLVVEPLLMDNIIVVATKGRVGAGPALRVPSPFRSDRRMSRE